MTVEQALSTRSPRSVAEAAEEHLDDVFGYLLYLTRDRETAEDLTSSTFEKAVRLWQRFDPARGSARTWLLGIARTTALDWFRAEARRRRREEAAALPERVEESFAEGLSPELERGLATLSAGEREVLQTLEPLVEEDVELIQSMMGRHVESTRSEYGAALLAEWPVHEKRFVKVMPKDYRRVLEAGRLAHAQGREPTFGELVGATSG